MVATDKKETKLNESSFTSSTKTMQKTIVGMIVVTVMIFL